MIRAIVAALRRAAADDDARAVVLASAVPRRFCAGLDLTMLLGKSGEQVREFLQALYVDSQRCSVQPRQAVDRGGRRRRARRRHDARQFPAMSFSPEKARAFGYPEIDIGVPPAIHFAHLPRIVGRHRAFELLFSGRSFDPQEASDLGLVSKIVPDAELDAAATALAAGFCRQIPGRRCGLGAPHSCGRTISIIGAASPTRSRISATP